MRSLRTIFVVLSLTFALPAMAQVPEDSDEPIRVLVLGTYHFGNPGLDINNVEADNVTSLRRQRELEALSDALREFSPTVIAHEGRASPPYLDSNFAEFSPADLKNDPNEITQIAYRLANGANIVRVYAIDEQPGEGEPSYFPFENLQAFARERGMESELSRITNMSALMQSFEKAQSTQSIPELLMLWNGETFNDSFYWEVVKFGKGETQPGPELAAYWFLRNAKIFNKLNQNVEPGDRVVIVYGAGHGHWLRELVERTPGYELEPVMPYLMRAARALKN